MLYFDVLFAAIAIGVAASLGGMIWPFQRGAAGVVLNVVTAVLGSLVAMLVSYAILPWGSHHDTPVRLALCAVGALAALVLAHLVWNRYAAWRKHEAEPVRTSRTPRAPSAGGL